MGKNILRRNVLEKIYESSAKFLEPLTPQETYKIIAEEGTKLIDGKYSTIFLSNKGRLQRVFTYGPYKHYGPYKYKMGIRKMGYTYKTFKSGKPIVITIEEFLRIHPNSPVEGVKSIFIIPLSYKGKTIGVFNLHSKKRYKNSAKELRILKLFGSMATLAIRNTQLFTATQEALSARDIFISMAAHELRTPLTPINGYAHLLHTKLIKGQQPNPEWAAIVKSKASKMAKIVNIFLQADRIKRGEFEYCFEEHDMGAIINKAVAEFKINYPGYKIQTENTIQNGPIHIIADKEKISLVLNNILSNCAQSSDSDNSIRLIVSQNKSSYMISILGKCKPNENDHDIFSIFSKGSHTSNNVGVGAFICKSIVERHKGSIKISSSTNKGRQVKMSFPKINS